MSQHRMGNCHSLASTPTRLGEGRTPECRKYLQLGTTLAPCHAISNNDQEDRDTKRQSKCQEEITHILSGGRQLLAAQRGRTPRTNELDAP